MLKQKKLAYEEKEKMLIDTIKAGETTLKIGAKRLDVSQQYLKKKMN